MADSFQNQPPPQQLGSLAQSSRLGELKAARWILIILGIINLGAHIYLMVNLQNEIAQVENSPNMVINQDAVGKARLALILGFGIGITFIVCGLLAYKAPVPATLVGLIVYIAVHSANAMMDPKTIVHGIIWKVLIIVCLAKAVQAAFAYKRETDQTGFGANAA